MEMQKYFEILGLETSATIDEVEKAYTTLLRGWQTDRYRNIPRFKRKAEAKLKEINNAYENIKSILVSEKGEHFEEQTVVCPHCMTNNLFPLHTQGSFVNCAKCGSHIYSKYATGVPDNHQEDIARCGDQHCTGRIGPDGRCNRCGKPHRWKRPEPVKATIFLQNNIWLKLRKLSENSKSQILFMASFLQKNIWPKFNNLSIRGKFLILFIALSVIWVFQIFYKISDHQQDTNHQVQAPANEIENHPSNESDNESSPLHPMPQSGIEFGGNSKSANPINSLSTDDQKYDEHKTIDKLKTRPEARIDYDDLLTKKALSRYNLDPDRVKRIQKSLSSKGYEVGPIDGILGPKTLGALRKFAVDYDIKQNGLFVSDLIGAILIYAEITEVYPEWHTVINSDDFGLWIEKQTDMQSDDDKKMRQRETAQQIIEILNLYKFDKEKPAPLPLPLTGIIEKSFTKGYAPVQIIAKPKDKHYFIQFVSNSNKREILTAFVRGNTELTLGVPPGKYEFKYATGKIWYGQRYLFGPGTIYSGVNKIFNFKKTGSQKAGYTVKLF